MILKLCDFWDVDGFFFLIDFGGFQNIFSSLLHAFFNLSHAANRQAVARQGEAAAGLRAVDLSSDQRPMREDERSRIVQQATCAVVIRVGFMEEDWIGTLSCEPSCAYCIMYLGRQTHEIERMFILSHPSG